MKLLDIDGFAALNGVLGSVQCPGVVVTARLEAYSCKRVSHDKKLAKIIQERAATSPNTVAQQPSPSIMPFPVGFGEDGSFALTPLEYQPSFASDDVSVPLQGDSAEDRAAIVDLITALNVSYSDHDFTDVHPSYFGRETQKSVRAVINNKLSMPSQELRKAGVPDLEAAFWREVDRVVGLKESEFFSYNPPSSESPVESTSWGHFFFVVNKHHEVNKLVLVVLYGVAGDDDVAMEIDDHTFTSAAPQPGPSRVSSSNSLPGLEVDACGSPSRQESYADAIG